MFICPGYFFVTSHSLQTNCRFSLGRGFLRTQLALNLTTVEPVIFYHRLEKRGWRLLEAASLGRAKCAPAVILFVGIASNPVSLTLLRLGLDFVARHVILHHSDRLLLANAASCFREAAPQRVGYAPRLPVSYAAHEATLTASFFHASPFALCFSLLRICRLCDPASPSHSR